MLPRNSTEQKVASKIATMVNDLTLDLDQVGIYIARENNITYRRVMEIADSAKYEKEDKQNDRNYIQ